MRTPLPRLRGRLHSTQHAHAQGALSRQNMPPHRSRLHARGSRWSGQASGNDDCRVMSGTRPARSSCGAGVQEKGRTSQFPTRVLQRPAVLLHSSDDSVLVCFHRRWSCGQRHPIPARRERADPGGITGRGRAEAARLGARASESARACSPLEGSGDHSMAPGGILVRSG